MERRIFAPHELKTVEIDVEKKIFRVNGEDFGNRCEMFELNCSANRKKGLSEYLKVTMRVKTGILFANYDFNGEKTSEECRKRRMFGK